MAKGKIRVIFNNGVGEVDPSELDALIKAGKVLAFNRGDKLAIIGIHRIREKKAEYVHPQRRMSDKPVTAGKS